MAKPWEGTFLWIWQADNVLGGNVANMIKAAKDMGVTGVIIKYSDGNLVGDPVSQKFMADFKKLAPAFKAAGFVVGGWTYQYLTDVAGEVDAVAQAIAAGADFIILDGEKDVCGKGAQVAQFGKAFRAKFPTIPVGFSSYAIPDYHSDVPFDAYNAFVDFMAPQIYWATMGWSVDNAFNQSVASYKKYGKPIAPTGQSYDKATSTDMARFVFLCNAYGFTHVSWWDWQHMTADHVAGVKANIVAQPADPAPSIGFTKDDAQPVIDFLGKSYNIAGSTGIQNAIHYAADALRDAVGLPKQ